MALEDSGSRHARKMFLGERFRVRDQLVNIGKVGMFLGIDEIRHEEAGPSIARFRVRDQEGVIRKNNQITPWTVQPKGTLGSGNQAPDHDSFADDNYSLIYHRLQKRPVTIVR